MKEQRRGRDQFRFMLYETGKLIKASPLTSRRCLSLAPLR